MTNGSLMKVKSIAECSPWSILQYFWPALTNYPSSKPIFSFLLSGCLRQVLLFIQSNQPTAVMIRLCRCAGWSSNLSFFGMDRFSNDSAHMYVIHYKWQCIMCNVNKCSTIFNSSFCQKVLSKQCRPFRTFMMVIYLADQLGVNLTYTCEIRLW